MKYISFIKRYVVVLVLICSVLFAAPYRAYAIFGIGDIVLDPANLANAIANFATTAAKWLADEAMKTLRDVVVKRIIDDMTDDIIKSIENGGDPLFVTNPDKFLQRSSDIAFDSVNRWIEQYGVNLCGPFAAELQISFNATHGERTFSNLPVECTYDQFKQNVQKESNFISEGKWISFNQMFQPENNFFGMSLVLDNAYMTQQNKHDEARKIDLANSGGFLAVKRCTAWKTDGNGVQWNESKVNSECSGSGRLNGESEDSCKDRLTQEYCSTFETVTPGKVVAETATKGMLKDFAYAENVQSILSAWVNKQISNMFDRNKGIVNTKSTSPGGRQYDYSSYSGGLQESRAKQAKRIIQTTLANYLDLKKYLTEVRKKALTDRDLAMSAIVQCGSVKKFKDDQPPFSPNIYGAVQYDSKLGTGKSYGLLGSVLLDYPLPTSTYPESVMASGTPSRPVPSQLIPVPPFGYVPMNPPGPAVPLSAALSALNERSHQYAVDNDIEFPDKEGYFTAIVRQMDAAIPVTQQKSDELKIIKETQLSLFDSTSTEDIASSSALLSRISQEYNDFTQEYSSIVADFLLQKQMSGGDPGAGGSTATLADVLDRLYAGLSRTDYFRFLGIPLFKEGKYGTNFFYCEQRT